MLKLQNVFFLVGGSASTSTEQSTVQCGLDFVSLLTREIINAGGGFVVYLTSEPVNEFGQPLIFDWLIAREVKALADSIEIQKRLKIITSRYAQKEKMNPEQRALISALVASNVAEIEYISDDTITGGNIGDAQVRWADAMIAIGGGKGVFDRAAKMIQKQCPILPMDLELGAFSEDDKGKSLLDRFTAEPTRFFPQTGSLVASRLPALSLEQPADQLESIAKRVVGEFSCEIDAKRDAASPDVLLVTALPIELSAAKLVFGVSDDAPKIDTSKGIHTWQAKVEREAGQVVSVRVASFGSAGNYASSAITTSLINELKPKHVLMLGIAAGMRGKCKLGDVVISDRIVAYEGRAEIAGGSTEPRPEITRVSFFVQQDLVAYLADGNIESRLAAGMYRIALELPKHSPAGDVTTSIVPNPATLASGESLLRNPDKFHAMRELHGKTEVAEMEAAGISEACRVQCVDFVVIRGISDFGDSLKDNSFHEIASKAAAIVALDYVKYGNSFTKLT